MNEFNVTTTSYMENITDADPDGADRGGYHQFTQRIAVRDGVTLVSQECDDEEMYRERIGDFPEPLATTKADAAQYLRDMAESLQKRAGEVLALAAMVDASTGFKLDLVESEDDDSEDD